MFCSIYFLIQILEILISLSILCKEFRTSFFLRMYWKDERLSYINTGYKKRLSLNAKMVQHMWIPDIYFVNEKSGIKHDLTKENELIRLWPDGRVFHSMRYVRVAMET